MGHEINEKYRQRLGCADPGSEDYLHPEVFLNNLKLVSINNGTERAIAVVIVNKNGEIIDFEKLLK